MNPTLKKLLKEVCFNSKLNIDVPLAPLTTWKIGGTADFVIEPTYDELPPLISILAENSIPYSVLGKGSNVLVDSRGTKKVIILTKRGLRTFEDNGEFIIADAGIPMPKLARYAFANGLPGFEFLIGIPGTIGAGVAINAGLLAKQPVDMSTIVHKVEAVDNKGTIITYNHNEIEWQTRTTSILKNGIIVQRVWFKKPPKTTKEEIQYKTLSHLEARKAKQPLDKFTAGSTFKPPTSKTPPGKLIELCGLKGYRIGGAIISKKHANWIENYNTATSDDVKRLIDTVIETVLKQHSIELEPEVQYIS